MSLPPANSRTAAKTCFISVCLGVLGSLYVLGPLPAPTAAQVAVALDIRPIQFWGVILQAISVVSLFGALLHRTFVPLLLQVAFALWWTGCILFGYIATLFGVLDYAVTERALAQTVVWILIGGFAAFTAAESAVEPRATKQLLRESLETRR